MSLIATTKVLGITAAGILSGLQISFSHITMPMVIQTAPDAVIAKQWFSLYKIGAAVAPPYAITCALCFGFLAYQSRKLPGLFPDAGALDPTTPFALYTAAAVSIPAIVPWTLTQMTSTNDRLMLKAEQNGAYGLEEAQALVAKWVALHMVRVGLVVFGTVCGACGVVLS